MLPSPERVLMTTLVSTCQSDLGSPNDEVQIIVRCFRMQPDSQVTIANETFSQSQPEDADIFGEGADDDVSYCMLSCFESYG